MFPVSNSFHWIHALSSPTSRDCCLINLHLGRKRRFSGCPGLPKPHPCLFHNNPHPKNKKNDKPVPSPPCLTQPQLRKNLSCRTSKGIEIQKSSILLLENLAPRQRELGWLADDVPNATMPHACCLQKKHKFTPP